MKSRTVSALIGALFAACVIGLAITNDPHEADRAEAYKQETIAAARKKVRLERIASDMRIQIAEAK